MKTEDTHWPNGIRRLTDEEKEELRVIAHEQLDELKGNRAMNLDDSEINIRITPEMMKAGMKAFCRGYDADVTVYAIFVAMVGASPQLCRHPVVDLSE